MALYSIDSQLYVEDIPHREDFALWRSCLTDGQFEAICDELLGMIDGAEIHTAGWMPGSDWTGTPWESIYTMHAVQRGGCRSVLRVVRVVVLPGASDTWGFGRYEKDGFPIRSMTYFRLANPPPR